MELKLFIIVTSVFLFYGSLANLRRSSAHPFLKWIRVNGEWELTKIQNDEKKFDLHEISFLQTEATQASNSAPDHAICTCRLESGAGGSPVNDLVQATFRQLKAEKKKKGKNNSKDSTIPPFQQGSNLQVPVSRHYNDLAMYPVQTPMYVGAPISYDATQQPIQQQSQITSPYQPRLYPAYNLVPQQFYYSPGQFPVSPPGSQVSGIAQAQQLIPSLQEPAQQVFQTSSIGF